MDWTQCLTIIGTTISVSGGLFLITRKDMQLMENKLTQHSIRMDENHREDMAKIDNKWEKLFGLFIELKLRNEK